MKVGIVDVHGCRAIICTNYLYKAFIIKHKLMAEFIFNTNYILGTEVTTRTDAENIT